MFISISQKVAFGVFTKAGVTFMGASVTRLRNTLGADIEPYVGKGEEGDTITIPTSYLDILCPRLVKAGFIIRIDP